MRERRDIRVVLSNYRCELRECLINIYTFHLYNYLPHKVIARVNSVMPVEDVGSSVSSFEEN